MIPALIIVYALLFGAANVKRIAEPNPPEGKH